MTDDEDKNIEQRGYARGYAAGRRRMEFDLRAERKYASNADFMDAAFLAVFPACVLAENWKNGDKPITSSVDRTDLAWRLAEAALKQRRHP